MWWHDRWTAFRDRLITSPEFRRWAARHPSARPIARRRASALFDLCAGFVYSQVLFACVRLRLFELLHARARTAAEIAEALSLSTYAAERLVRAASALRLCEPRSGGRYGLGVLGAAMVNNPGLSAMVEHHSMLYADLANPVALLRGEASETTLARYWGYARDRPAAALGGEATRPYTELMAASLGLVAAEVVDAYRFDRHRCLLDVGGGDGSFVAAVATRAPSLRLVVFDLPSVADRAKKHLAAKGLAGRAGVVGGDFLVDPLPAGADIVSLVRVLHDHDDLAALRLLRAVRLALPAGGTILIAEPMAETLGAERVGDAYFGFYLLAMGNGRPRSSSEHVRLLRAGGFHRSRSIPTRLPLITSLIVAQVSA
jgi:demethylspheroidene O-methyltransferase